MGIVDTLMELTKGERNGGAKEFVKEYSNGKTVLEKTEPWGDGEFHFYDNGQELLLYRNRKIVYSCNYAELYGRKHITEVWGHEGLVFHKNMM